MAEQAKAAIPWYANMDQHGTNPQRRCGLTAFQRQSAGGAAPQGNDHLGSFPAEVLVSDRSGRWQVETMDGTRGGMWLGDASFGGDQNCRIDAQERMGHTSDVVGSEPAVLVIAELEIAPTRNQPGHRA